MENIVQKPTILGLNRPVPWALGLGLDSRPWALCLGLVCRALGPVPGLGSRALGSSLSIAIIRSYYIFVLNGIFFSLIWGYIPSFFYSYVLR